MLALQAINPDWIPALGTTYGPGAPVEVSLNTFRCGLDSNNKLIKSKVGARKKVQ